MTKAHERDGCPFGITCGQIDIGPAGTAMTEAITAGLRQAGGALRPEPGLDVVNVLHAVFRTASLPADATIPLPPIMAPGMPWPGRG